jgi:alcohol dehydrogenase
MNEHLRNLQQGKAAIFNGHGQPFEFVTRQIPPLLRGEILVRTLYTTICGSDVHTYCGRRLEPPNVVLGHEIVGEIVMTNEEHSGKDYRGEKIEVGDRITWCIFAVPEGMSAPMPDIPQKSNGLFKYGHALASGDDVFNGGLADYCIVKANTAVIKISKDIPVQVAATISCAHSTVAGALRVAGNVRDKNVLVFGAGLLGLSCVAMCREAGASEINVVDTDSSRLHWGAKFGADASYLSRSDGMLPWPEADIVFDMTGNAKAMKSGLDSLSIGGVAIWIGAVFPSDPVQVDAQKVVRRLLQIRGLHNYNYDDFLQATTFIEKHFTDYPFEKLVEKEFSLSDVEEAFVYAKNIKPVRVGIRVQ